MLDLGNQLLHSSNMLPLYRVYWVFNDPHIRTNVALVKDICYIFFTSSGHCFSAKMLILSVVEVDLLDGTLWES